MTFFYTILSCMIPYKKDAESKSDILFAVITFHSLSYTYTASPHGSVLLSGYLPAVFVRHCHQRRIHHHCMFLTPASLYRYNLLQETHRVVYLPVNSWLYRLLLADSLCVICHYSYIQAHFRKESLTKTHNASVLPAGYSGKDF